jgi:hypothetical protein
MWLKLRSCAVRRWALQYSDLLAAVIALIFCLLMGYVVFEKDPLGLGQVADGLLWLSVLAFLVLTIRCVVQRFSAATERQMERH